MSWQRETGSVWSGEAANTTIKCHNNKRTFLDSDDFRKSSGDLHFYVNGQDQGVAATKVPQQMWGVVDLYGMTVKVKRHLLLHPFDSNL